MTMFSDRPLPPEKKNPNPAEIEAAALAKAAAKRRAKRDSYFAELAAPPPKKK